MTRALAHDDTGLVDQLLAALKVIDPSRGDRLEDRPEVEVGPIHCACSSGKLTDEIGYLPSQCWVTSTDQCFD
jgi:hypothetical protein